jgi:hypothetical protein
MSENKRQNALQTTPKILMKRWWGFERMSFSLEIGQSVSTNEVSDKATEHKSPLSSHTFCRATIY